MTGSPGGAIIIDWKAISVLVTVVLAWSGLLLGAIRWLLERYQKNTDHRFGTLEKDGEKTKQELTALRVNLPVEYVRKDDAIRQETWIHAKLDGLSQKMDKLITKEVPHE